MKTKKPNEYRIISGPKEDLLLTAFRYTYNDEVNVKIDFTVVFNKNNPKEEDIVMATRDFRIESMKHKGITWYIIEGYCEAEINSYHGVLFKKYRYKIEYNVERKKGKIAFFPFP